MQFTTALFLLCGTAAASGSAISVTPFPEKILGVWMPSETPQAVLGPIAKYFLVTVGEHSGNGGFSAQRDPKTGDVWFTVLQGQIFRVSGNNMQYCFGPRGTLFEQSPFSVNSTSDTDIKFCWRTGLVGMPTHRTTCRGCDCASIQISLDTSNDSLEFTFLMSPPVVHAHIKFSRSGAPRSIDKALWTMSEPYQQCTMKDHYGPNVVSAVAPSSTIDGRRVPGCMFAVGAKAKAATNTLLFKQDSGTVGNMTADGKCWQLNGLNLKIHDKTPFAKFKIPDVKLQYKLPLCDSGPCVVSYSVSAAIDEDEYIALGFKGESWEGKFYSNGTNRTELEKTQRPCYFGMCVDSYDNYTSNRIALGYASSTYGSCVREMVATEYVGAPQDAGHKIMSHTSVERINGRVILRFSLPQNRDPHPRLVAPLDGPFRIMWAIGKLSGAHGCTATLGYHDLNRGVHPIYWLNIGSTPCQYDPTH